LRCDGFFNDYITANLTLSLPVKKFENWSAYCNVMGKSMVALVFERQCK